MTRPVKPFGLFILGNHVLSGDGEICFNDRCYSETLAQTSQYVPHSLIVARTRPNDNAPDEFNVLGRLNAELGLVMPDYGAAGFRGLLHAIKIVLDSKIRRSLTELIKQAEFVYVEEGTNIISFLAAQIAKQTGRRLIFEMRASTLLNKQYLRDRFGLAGLVLAPCIRTFSSIVRRQCFAGLYINEELMNDYPVAGSHKSAISDAYLPQDFGGSARRYHEPARRYLYVGHLETRKRVDIIIEALHLSQDGLPVGWHFDIVGSGPLESKLRALADRLGLSGNITFHGRLPWEGALRDLYEQADLALFASTTEGAQRTLPEAMAFGLPIISTRVGNAPEVLDESVLVPVGEPKAYSRCLLSLVHDTKRLTEISDRNWRLARNYRRSVLVLERSRFWEEAIRMSQNQQAGFNANMAGNNANLNE